MSNTEQNEKQIEISSTIGIIVSPNLEIDILTDPQSINPNKMRAKISDQTKPIRIVEGKALYPYSIVTWDAVIQLEKAKILTLGKTIGEDGKEDFSELERLQSIEAKYKALTDKNKKAKAEVKPKAEAKPKIEDSKAIEDKEVVESKDSKDSKDSKIKDSVDSFELGE